MKSYEALPLLEVTKIKELVTKTMKELGVYTDFPVGNDLRQILEKEKVVICEYPFGISEQSHTDGTITIFDTPYGELTFIGLNSSLYYDEQIFALAHEYYHYLTKTGKAYQNIDEDLIVERKADRFAAEFLLPSAALSDRVIKVFNNKIISDETPILRILRFIATLQIDWWLTYRSIVWRLFEEDLISEYLFNALLEIDCRNEDGEYAKILKNLDEKIFDLLNSKSENIKISQQAIMATISNFEDGDISEDAFLETMHTFGKEPSDFGYDICVEEDEDFNYLSEGDYADES